MFSMCARVRKELSISFETRRCFHLTRAEVLIRVQLRLIPKLRSFIYTTIVALDDRSFGLINTYTKAKGASDFARLARTDERATERERERVHGEAIRYI